MHPSKAQQSTTKGPDSGLRLGFSDIKDKEKNKAVEATPSKTVITSDGFEFKWSRPQNDLSDEAQRIMASVREEAARIKERMRVERGEQARKDGEADQLSVMGNRKIATPRRKTGRFSNAHKEDFKRMDSIMNHGSLWKNKFATLKRSQSKADIGDSSESSHPENPSPGKRIKKLVDEDVSSARPISRDGPPTGIPRSLPSAVTTPTKASLARSQSVKNLRSKLPALSPSKSMKQLASPSSKTEGANKYLLGLKNSVSMKSILHKPQPKYSNDPAQIAAGTHLPISSSSSDDKLGSPTAAPARSPLKRVEFADEVTITSPSPTKIPTAARSAAPSSPQKVSYPNLDKRAPLSSHPPGPGDFTFRSAKQISFEPPSKLPTTIRHVRPSGVPTTLTPFEPFPAAPHGMPNKKRRRADDDEGGREEASEDTENQPPAAREEEVQGSPAKKPRLGFGRKAAATATVAEQPAAPSSPRRRLFKSRRPTGSVSPQKKGGEGRKGLSLARLNALARPKQRN